MKTLHIYSGQYGLFFFDGDALVQYLHENDADYRPEYHGPILKWAGVETPILKKLSIIQQELVDRYES